MLPAAFSFQNLGKNGKNNHFLKSETLPRVTIRLKIETEFDSLRSPSS